MMIIDKIITYKSFPSFFRIASFNKKNIGENLRRVSTLEERSGNTAAKESEFN